ncbi:hypothetical protein RO3G_11356 [Rhizopus delemar RA 99-880]|uniref:EamA domain-containing protein n=1 Tax=Rhizopus delemar (strain RA 99-880 / ATCC MYA-4621 / FGSC 9543 / NRRL 43880) TaxID=246409 RepID=I1CDW5_RHIO9|nr:hypothetical protein RO3G_11356 [Rhizopus delemar RA 99-880]|eukprot:EIE86645.1 hypothetical protein RO3G_11356 [Rhizopus delemar RA 99-880]
MMSIMTDLPTKDTFRYIPIEEEQEEENFVQTKEKASQTTLATVMLTVCIITFVLQTELAQYVQKTTNYSKPYFIFLVQDFKDIMKTSQQSIQRSFKELQYHAQGNNENVFVFIVKTTLLLSILITLPAYIWYLSVNLTSMSNLTAIYNTSCLFAYLFSIVMLQEHIMASKVVAVMLCMLGVLAMAYWPGSEPIQDDGGESGSWVGILVSCIGASLYGFYEVYYKKYASPSKPTVLFANAVTSLIGLVTFLTLWIPIPLLHLADIEPFAWPDARTFGYILAIASMSVIYNATFMVIIALVNPVFAAVGVMLTVPAVAITDVLVTGVMVSSSTIVGSLLILVGFYILNRQQH